MSANRAAVAVVLPECYMVGMADEHIQGYTPTTYTFETYDEAKACAKNINEKLGHTPERALEIIAGSMWPAWSNDA